MTVTYADGTSSTFTLSLPDWTTGATNVVLSMPYRDQPNGGGDTGSQPKVYYAKIGPFQKQVQAITFPNNTMYALSASYTQ